MGSACVTPASFRRDSCARDVHLCARASTRNFLGPRSPALLVTMASRFNIQPLTSRKRAHIEEQRTRNAAAAFERLHFRAGQHGSTRVGAHHARPPGIPPSQI